MVYEITTLYAQGERSRSYTLQDIASVEVVDGVHILKDDAGVVVGSFPNDCLMSCVRLSLG